MNRLRWWLKVRWWTVRNYIRSLKDRWVLSRLDPTTIAAPELPESTKVLTDNDWYGAMERMSLVVPALGDYFWELLIDRWPDSPRTSLGVVPEYARANRQNVMLMDEDVRQLTLRLLEIWLAHLNAAPPERDDELIDALEDIEAIATHYRHAVSA